MSLISVPRGVPTPAPEPRPRNRAERRRLAQQVVRRGDAPGSVTREARRMFAKAVQAAELEQRENEAKASAEERGLVVAKKKIWTPKEGPQ